MYRVRAIIAMAFVLVIMASSVLQGQDKDKKEPPKGVTLPNYYNKLGLSEEQKKKILQIRGEMRDKVDELKKKIDEVETKSRQEWEAVLTADQKARLKEIAISKVAPKDSVKDSNEPKDK